MRDENNNLVHCDFWRCNNHAVALDTDTDANLCEYHMDHIEDKTGYCSTACRLGYGCDWSC